MHHLELPGYTVHISDLRSLTGHLNQHLKARTWSRVAVLVDENTEQDCWPLISEANWPTGTERLEIPAGELYKTLSTCEGLWEAFTNLELDRHSLLVNLGGGVIGDMGGFAASTYMRGFSFLNIPTTLLAQVDASVGGKLGVDFNGLKNMIGLFADPRGVLICPEFLATLPYEQLRSGYAEVLKHALIRDRKSWTELAGQSLEDVLDWETLIARSVSIKKAVVEADPNESGLRKILNFGHTIGHAVESLQLESDAPLLHGDAIAVGMIAETWLSYRACGMSGVERDAVAQSIAAVYPRFKLADVTVESVLELMRLDKKNRAGEIRFSLLPSIGACKPDVVLPEEKLGDWLGEALEYYQDTYKPISGNSANN
ncbi:MAG: 3-dehydroquinate synthase [Bacteroidetes bacterium]|nr:3-dehydroquinate synthase [Bacteroidota bacterium]